MGNGYTNPLVLFRLADEDTLVDNTVLVIPAGRNLYVAVVHNQIVGGVKCDPAAAAADFDPGMAQSFTDQHSYHIAGRDVFHTAEGEQNMGVVLADSFSQGHGLFRCCVDVGHMLDVLESPIKAMHVRFRFFIGCRVWTKGELSCKCLDTGAWPRIFSLVFVDADEMAFLCGFRRRQSGSGRSGDLAH